MIIGANMSAWDFQALLRHKMYGRQGTISRLSTETRDHLFNHNYSDSPNNDNALWHSTGNQF